MASSSNEKLILVVDDDNSIRQLIISVLTAEGYKVEGAGNGAEALALIRQNRSWRPGLILLDMQMPVMDGWKFLPVYHHEVKPEEKAPVVVMTAAMTAARYASQINADGFLAKPFNLEELLNLVRQYLPIFKDPL
ncbi:MAG: response regulator receiver protein [Chloroflexi bacterium]|jgi:two-component system chemotaxis response regulator CheY|nr:response regulator receiver protein [Chloroflexota bacterium]